MPRPFLGESGLAASAQRSEIIHLLELEFSGGTVRFTTGPHDITLDPHDPGARAVRIGETTTRHLIRNPVGSWPTSAATVEFWGRLDSGLSLAEPNFALSYGVAGNFNELLVGLQSVSGTWRPYFERPGGAVQGAPEDAIPDDHAWRHYAFTWQSSDGATALYVNGVLAQTGTLATGNPIDAAGVVVLGQDQDSLGGGFDGNQAWKGELDGVRVYSRVLSAAEVAEHFDGVFEDETGLVAEWGFDNAGNLGFDDSPAANHLTPVGITAGTVETPDAVVFSAAGSAMTFDAVGETTDPSGQRLKLTLDGVSLGAIAALLAEGYIGREGRLWRAHVDDNGRIVANPILLFRGLMNAPWEVNENPDEGSARVETELVSPLALLDQVRGITADLNSHQAHFPTDTFFAHIADKPEGDFGWGVSERVPQF